MPLESLAARMLEAADLLLAEGHVSAAFRRRAVSTAYYAVFHAIAKLCADSLMAPADHGANYERVYRALEHGAMRQAFGRAPLAGNPKLRSLGISVLQLQTERFNADYMPPLADVFPTKEAQDLVDLARALVDEIETMDADSTESRMLAANLLFKDRRQ